MIFEVSKGLTCCDSGLSCAGERAPWENEIECKLFSPPIGGVGPSNEVRVQYRLSDKKSENCRFLI